MRPDEGPSYPPLPPDAGEKERALYEIYDFQSGIVSYTADQWKQTAEDLSDLAISVRGVVSQLRRAPDSGEAWSGSAAEAAYDSLGKLAANLDRHAEDITRIESGLTAAYDAVSDARSQYVAQVRTVDTSIDQSGYMRDNPGPPGGPTLEPTLDTAAYDAAVADARQKRENRAAAVMASYEADMESAAKKLPVEPAESPVTDGRYPSGPGGGSGPSGGGSGPRGGAYVPPGGGGGGWVVGGGGPDGPDGPDGPGGNPGNPVGPGPVDIGCPGPGPDPVLDGPGDGGGLLPETGGPGPGGGTTGPGGSSGGGIGGAGTALGMGGMVAGGGAALLGRGGGGAGLFGRGGGVTGVGTTNGASARGGTGAAGRSSVLGSAGQGSANGRATGGRGGAAGRGTTGRYGVPQLGEKGGRGSTMAAAGSAGSRGTADRKDGQDVDHLTTEDEETWFEGADDASPPVWE